MKRFESSHLFLTVTITGSLCLLLWSIYSSISFPIELTVFSNSPALKMYKDRSDNILMLIQGQIVTNSKDDGSFSFSLNIKREDLSDLLIMPISRTPLEYFEIYGVQVSSRNRNVSLSAQDLSPYCRSAMHVSRPELTTRGTRTKIEGNFPLLGIQLLGIQAINSELNESDSMHWRDVRLPATILSIFIIAFLLNILTQI